MNIYELYGRQEERHAQEMAALSDSFFLTIQRLKDGSLKIEDVELANGKLRIPGPTTPVEPEAPSDNGTEKAEAKADARGKR